MSPISLNNRLIVEAYDGTRGLQANVSKGFATVQQKTALKPLEVLMNAVLSDGTVVKKGSMAFVKEHTLNTQPWAKAPFDCEFLPLKFLILNISDVEFIVPPNDETAA